MEAVRSVHCRICINIVILAQKVIFAYSAVTLTFFHRHLQSGRSPSPHRYRIWEWCLLVLHNLSSILRFPISTPSVISAHAFFRQRRDQGDHRGGAACIQTVTSTVLIRGILRHGRPLTTQGNATTVVSDKTTESTLGHGDVRTVRTSTVHHNHTAPPTCVHRDVHHSERQTAPVEHTIHLSLSYCHVLEKDLLCGRVHVSP